MLQRLQDISKITFDFFFNLVDDFFKLTATQKGAFAFVCLLLAGTLLQTWSLLVCFLSSILLAVPVINHLSKQQRHYNTEFLPDFVKKLKIHLKNVSVDILKIKSDYPSTESINPKKFNLHLGEELNTLLKYIERDFVDSWYFDVIEGSPSWAKHNHKLFEILFSKIRNRLSNVGRVSAIKSFIQLFSSFVADYQEAQLNLKQQPHYARKRNKEKEFKKIKTVEQSFESLGKFHIALTNNDSELEYLRSLTEVILQVLLPERLMECTGGRIILQEILMQNILYKLVHMMSEPEWLHQVMVKVLSDEKLIIVDEGKQRPTCNSEERGNHDTEDTHVTQTFNQHSVSDDCDHRVQQGEAVSNQSNTDSTKQEAPHDQSVKMVVPEIVEPKIGEVPPVQKSYTTEDLAKLLRVKTPINTITKTEMFRTVQLPVTVHEGTSVAHTFRQSSLSCEPSQNQQIHSLTRSGSMNILSSSPSSSVASYSGTSQSGSSTCASLLPEPLGYQHRLTTGLSDRELHNTLDVLDQVSQGSNDNDDHFDSSDVETFSDGLNEVEGSEETILPDVGEMISTDVGGILTSSDVQQKMASNIAAAEAYEALVDASDVPVGCDVVAELNTDPEFIFEMIVVPEFEEAREPGGSGFYTLYVIQYDAWHQDEDGNWTLQTTVLKRRFREFLTLNERLHEHSLYKKSMKDVKGPHRMLHMPLGVKDKSMIEKRRQFLQKYMKALIRKIGVCHSIPLKEFLAYEGDASIAFVKKASDVNRIDRVIVKTMTGVVDKLGKVFPSLPDDNQRQRKSVNSRERSHKRRRRRLTISQESATEDPDDMQVTFHGSQGEEVEHTETYLDLYINENSENPGKVYREDSFKGKPDNEEFHDPIDFSFFPNVPRSAGDGCEMSSKGNSEDFRDLDRGITLTCTLLDLAVQLAQGRQCWVCQERVLKISKIVFGKAFESFIQEEIDDLTTVKRWAFYVNQLYEAIWPNGHLDEEETVKSSDKQKEVTRTQAEKCLVNFFPDVLPLIVGHEDFQHCIDVVMASIEHSKLNRHFMYCFLDMLVEFTVPEISTADLHRQLLVRYIQQ